VTEVEPAGKALPRALELATEAARLPRHAVAVTKQLADVVPESSREAAILLERLAYAALGQTEDAREAGRAWAERRKSG
jgi:enoyl-CoA hydratase/carnithine racemase